MQNSTHAAPSSGNEESMLDESSSASTSFTDSQLVSSSRNYRRNDRTSGIKSSPKSGGNALFQFGVGELQRGLRQVETEQSSNKLLSVKAPLQLTNCNIKYLVKYVDFESLRCIGQLAVHRYFIVKPFLATLSFLLEI